MVAVTELDLGGPATLVVVWRTGQNAHGRVVKAGGPVMQHMRASATKAIERIRLGEGRPYDPNDEPDDECFYLEADREELLDTALLDEVQKGASLPLISPDDLRSRSLVLYALVVGSDPSQLTAFVRRGNPVQLAKKSLVAVFDNTLTRIEKPILTFDEFFDLVIFPGNVAILNQKNFEALFKESEAVLAKTAEWANNLETALPMSADSKDYLATRLQRLPTVRRKVLSILRSGYLAGLTPDLLRAKMTENGLDPDQLMDGDKLINKETEHDVLLLLNEDLWTGDFSGEQYAASKKARRSG
jgi:hypothetical protein